MKTEHKPGPWKITDLDETMIQIRLDRNYTHECINIADVHVMSGNLNEEVPKAVANARLIAAAPELLEALTSMVEAFKDECYLPHKTKAINKAIEIIKKAI